MGYLNYLFSEGGIPKINFRSSMPNSYGGKSVFSCKAELTGANIGLDVFWYFYKWDATVGQDVTRNAEVKKGGLSPVKTVDSVLNVIVGANTAGIYKCLVKATVQSSYGFNFTRNATLKGIDQSLSGMMFCY